MLEVFDLINLKYIYIVITLGIICVICVFKEFKVGIMASITGIIIISGVWGSLKLVEYLKSSMEREGIDYSMLIENIKAVFMAIGIFVIITFIYCIIMFFKNSNRKRINKKRGKRRYY